MGKFAIGGAGGSAGNGGRVEVNNSGPLSTLGDNANGIFAQSVGGGGGVAGSVNRVRTPDWDWLPDWADHINFGIGLDFARDGGCAGDGGDVVVTSTADITTHGINSRGIFAQSVGGGGGEAGGLGNISQWVNLTGSVGGDGSAGHVRVSHVGDITALGDASYGIVAQSAGGEDLGRGVDIELTGNISAEGEKSDGILAQSIGGSGAGNISVTIFAGSSVLGGSWDGVDTESIGVGIRILDGSRQHTRQCRQYCRAEWHGDPRGRR